MNVKAVIQRVNEARVEVDGQVTGSIGRGLLVFLGIGKADTAVDIEWMIDKIANLRIFESEAGKMDESLLDIRGELLVVSQFTLYGDCRKGRRPSFSDAMDADTAKSLFTLFVEKARQKVSVVQTGVFQAMMQVHLVNDGPVTLVVESPSASSFV